MARLPRNLLMPPDEVGIYHCFNRCAQQQFLCGFDPVTGADLSHRKQWMRDELRGLVGEFAIELYLYSLMDNHFHLLLRNRPDLVAEFDDLEVALRWWRISRRIWDSRDDVDQPRLVELDRWLLDPAAMKSLRERLANPSWLMRYWSHYTARRANSEAGRSGHFFEGRFKSVRLLDEAALLACALYIDLNPIRAGSAPTPETSHFTSVRDRIDGRRARLQRVLGAGLPLPPGDQLPVDVLFQSAYDVDAWLSPLTLDAESRLAAILAQWFPDAAAIDWRHLEPHTSAPGASSDDAESSTPRTLSPVLTRQADAPSPSPRPAASDSTQRSSTPSMTDLIDPAIDRSALVASPGSGRHAISHRFASPQFTNSSNSSSQVNARDNPRSRDPLPSVPLTHAAHVVHHSGAPVGGRRSGPRDQLGRVPDAPADTTLRDRFPDSHSLRRSGATRPGDRVGPESPDRPSKVGSSSSSPGVEDRQQRFTQWLADWTLARQKTPARIAHQGFLPLSLDVYLELLDWLGRQRRPGKSGAIPAHLPPVLERIGLRVDTLPALVERFTDWFRIAAGRADVMLNFFQRIGAREPRALRAGVALFGTS